MFPEIVKRIPSAHLNVFCDMEHEWSNKTSPYEMSEIKRMLSEQKEHVTNHGWVDKKTLREYFSKTHIWFYPCHFKETCCLTAYEAQASRTIIVTNHLGALSESVGDRGLIIDGVPNVDDTWCDRALIELFNLLSDYDKQNEYMQKGWEWIVNKRYEIEVSDFYEQFIKRN